MVDVADEADEARTAEEAPIVVGRIGRPHGVRGEVTVEVRTDVPERRFALGAVLGCEPAQRGPLVVAATHWHGGRLLVLFDGVADRAGAERLRDTIVTVPAAEAGDAGNGAWWDHELVGLSAVTVDGAPLGTVRDVLHTAGGDILALTGGPGSGGREVLVPFVASIVPEVDVAAGRVVLDPPPGLLELE
jgi:16S rRNA processing protein RimM